jgi:hypothetical protein
MTGAAASAAVHPGARRPRAPPPRGGLLGSEEIAGQPHQAGHRPAGRAGQGTAQTDAVPVQPPRQLPRQDRARPDPLVTSTIEDLFQRGSSCGCLTIGTSRPSLDDGVHDRCPHFSSSAIGFDMLQPRVELVSLRLPGRHVRNTAAGSGGDSVRAVHLSRRRANTTSHGRDRTDTPGHHPRSRGNTTQGQGPQRSRQRRSCPGRREEPGRDRGHLHRRTTRTGFERRGRAPYRRGRGVDRRQSSALLLLEGKGLVR